MNGESREELLSAYLDDEVSAEERARVEAWLAEDAEFRRLRDELLSLRGDLQSLPRHKLNEDLGPAVLRRAEQHVLAGGRSAGSADVLPPGSPVAEWWSRRGTGRMFLWPAVAVAAALLVALFNTQQDQGPRNVAMEDAKLKRAGDAPDVTELKAAADEDAYASPSQPEAPGEVRRTAVMKNAREAPAAAPQSGESRSPVNGLAIEDLRSSGRAGERLMNDAQLESLVEPSQQKFFDQKKLETDVKRALENREQVNLIQCDVTPAFLQENPLEKVLTGNKIDFKCYAVPPADIKNNRAIRTQNELAPEENLGYEVQATPEQVETIVIELEQEQNRRRVSNLMLGISPTQDHLDAAAAAAKPRATLEYRASRQQPVTIYLRKQGVAEQQAAPPAAAPVQPAPADKP